MVSLVVWGVVKLRKHLPLWKKYGGTVIAAIKFAEKEIPDDVEAQSIKRLDMALKYAIQIIEETESRNITNSEKQGLTEGIQIVHANLEACGNLSPKKGDS